MDAAEEFECMSAEDTNEETEPEEGDGVVGDASMDNLLRCDCRDGIAVEK